MVESNPPKRNSWWIWIMGAGLLAIFASWGYVLFLVRHEATVLSEAGQAGDTFGALNALFTGLSSFGVIVAIYLQGQELHEQRNELRQSRIAQQEAAKAMEGQLKSSQLQSDISALREIIPLLHTLWNDAGKFRTMQTTRDDPISINMEELREEKERYEGLLLQKIREHFKVRSP